MDLIIKKCNVSDSYTPLLKNQLLLFSVFIFESKAVENIIMKGNDDKKLV